MIKRTKVLTIISHHATLLLSNHNSNREPKSPQNRRTEASFLRPKSRVKWPYHISIRFMVLSPLENGPKFPKDFQGNRNINFM